MTSEKSLSGSIVLVSSPEDSSDEWEDLSLSNSSAFQFVVEKFTREERCRSSQSSAEAVLLSELDFISKHSQPGILAAPLKSNPVNQKKAAGKSAINTIKEHEILSDKLHNQLSVEKKETVSVSVANQKGQKAPLSAATASDDKSRNRKNDSERKENKDFIKIITSETKNDNTVKTTKSVVEDKSSAMKASSKCDALTKSRKKKSRKIKRTHII